MLLQILLATRAKGGAPKRKADALHDAAGAPKLNFVHAIRPLAFTTKLKGANTMAVKKTTDFSQAAGGDEEHFQIHGGHPRPLLDWWSSVTTGGRRP